MTSPATFGADDLRAVVNGAPKRLHVCTSCIRAGKVTKPLRRNYQPSASS